MGAFVYPINAALENCSPHDMPVIEMLNNKRPFMDGRLPNNIDAESVRCSRRPVIDKVCRSNRRSTLFGNCSERFIGKPINEVDEKMTRAHCGITNAQF